MRNACHCHLRGGCVALLLGTVPTFAQGPPEPQFEVASVKPNPRGTGSLSGGVCMGSDSTFTVTAALPGTASAPVISPSTCRFGRTTLKEIVAAAYGIPRRDFERLIVGGPPWITGDLFDIEAKSDRPRPQAELERMLQALLADRFGLRLRREVRELDGYALIAARGGPQVKVADATTPSGVRTTLGGVITMTARATPMARLAELIALRFGKPVVDETGLAGRYDFTLTWTPGENEVSLFREMLTPDLKQRIAAGTDPNGPSLFIAVDEQLGLRLQPRKIPTEVLVIDAAHHPTPN